MGDLSLFKKNIIAIGFGIAAAAAFTFTDTICKYLTQDYSISQVICTTNAITLFLTCVWIFKSYGPKAFKTSHLKWHICRGLSVMATAFFVVNAFALIPLADFYGIVFLSPLVTIIMSHFLLKEMVGWHRLLATVIGFGGVLILAGPQFDTHNAGILFALGAVIFIALNAIFGRKMKEETVFPLFAFFPALFNTLAHLPFMIMDFSMPAQGDVAWFLIVAPILMTGFICGSLSFAKASETAVVMPFSYIQIILGALLGYLIFGDVPTLTTVAGCAVIIASGIYAIWREHIHHTQHIHKPAI